MRVHSAKSRVIRSGAVRLVALAGVLFVAAAATHESFLHIEYAAFQSHNAPRHGPKSPAPAHHQDHACALCELAGTPTLLTLDAALPEPQALLESINVALYLTPGVRDESCFPRLLRAPPSLSLV